MDVAKGKRLAVKRKRQLISSKPTTENMESSAAATIATLPAEK
jgi:hypothetical protein